MGEDKDLIVKRTIYAGNKQINFVDGTKVFFHFQTCLANELRTVIDDSRQMGDRKPMELVIGKKFKLEVWEAAVQKMALNEVAEFTVDKNLVMHYPFISKTLRDANKPEGERRKHCCAMVLQTEGIGYRDLEDYFTHPTDLIFTIELVKVELPGEYEKDSWQLTEDEKLKLVTELREEGNKLFKEKDRTQASDKYSQAIGHLEQLMLKEKPRSEEWLVLEQLKIPLLLNFSQCKLEENEFYAVIEHCTSVLKSDPDNIKALYRRAKAHLGAWNPEEARKDFLRVMELNPSIEQDVRKHLATLDGEIKKRNEEDKHRYKNLF